MKSKTHPESDQREYLKHEVARLRTLLTSRTSVMSMLTGAQDALAVYLDAEHGSSISDYKIFETLPRRMEKEFHEDMRALNVSISESRCSTMVNNLTQFPLMFSGP